MTDRVVFSFPNYAHNLLERKNAEALSKILRKTSSDISEIPLHEAKFNDIWLYMKALVAGINTFQAWNFVIHWMDGAEYKHLASNIVLVNQGRVKEIAYSTTAGTLVGSDLFQPLVSKYGADPIREVTLVAIERFRDPVSRISEIPHRIASVFGTLEEPGTFGRALGNFHQELLVGQPIVIDMLRVLSCDFLKRHFS